MKSNLIYCASGLLVGWLVGHFFFPKSNYEFHPAAQGVMMWRCNKITGVTETCTLNGAWTKVKDGEGMLDR